MHAGTTSATTIRRKTTSSCNPIGPMFTPCLGKQNFSDHILRIYCEEGISGKIPLRQRPEGVKLVQALAKKRAQLILTPKLDRLFRNAADALDQTAQWDKGKVALHIIDMGDSAIDTASAMGRMF